MRVIPMQKSSLSFLAFVTSLGASVAITAGCQSPGICALERIYGVRVTVLGGAEVPRPDGSQGGAGGFGTTAGAGAGGEVNSNAECLATATATETDGSFTEQLDCSVDKADCVCLGLTELPGEFSIRVELAGREETQTVRVRPEGCNVSTKQLTFFEN
jgi:hypothetical protein